MHIVAIYRKGKTLVATIEVEGGDDARLFAQDFNADRSNSLNLCAHAYRKATWDYDRAVEEEERLRKRRTAADRKRRAKVLSAVLAA